jgi:hypothetical protein
VQQVPDADAKLYAATQVVDEARHVEAYARLVARFGVEYPMTPPLRTLLDQVLRDSRWDMTYLGMQVIIEGLALAAFAALRNAAQKSPRARRQYLRHGRRGAPRPRSGASRCATITRSSAKRSARTARAFVIEGVPSHARSLRCGGALGNAGPAGR